MSGDEAGIQPLPQSPAAEAATWGQDARQCPEDLVWLEATEEIRKNGYEEHTNSRANSFNTFTMLSSYTSLRKNKGVTEHLCK